MWPNYAPFPCFFLLFCIGMRGCDMAKTQKNDEFFFLPIWTDILILCCMMKCWTLAAENFISTSKAGNLQHREMEFKGIQINALNIFLLYFILEFKAAVQPRDSRPPGWLQGFSFSFLEGGGTWGAELNTVMCSRHPDAN